MANQFNIVKSGDGVFEWADFSYNIGTGCENNCRYCYARDITAEMAIKDGKAFKSADWHKEIVRTWKADIHQTADGNIMFPSMHDVTPAYLQTYIKTLRNILNAGNQVVIVTKPRLECISTLCEQFQDHKEMMLFRMTITSLDENLARLWEPGAPLPEERLAALRLAFNSGYQTSVSVEPMIDSVDRTIELYQTVLPYLTEDIWFGKMNDIDRRVKDSSQETHNAIKIIREQQSDDNIHRLYGLLREANKVAWKDSIRKIVGF